MLKAAQGPHIIGLLDHFSLAGGRFVLVFPFLPLTLESWLNRGVLSPSLTSIAIRQLIEALQHIHGLGIIHRDVKPSNVLMTSPAGQVHLADFGIAWAPGENASEPADGKVTDVGTTSYRPPELLFGHSAYDCSLDMWAAGCVTAEVLTVGHSSLFDAGPLGSELALIQSIFQSLGTPTLEQWPVRS